MGNVVFVQAQAMQMDKLQTGASWRTFLRTSLWLRRTSFKLLEQSLQAWLEQQVHVDHLFLEFCGAGVLTSLAQTRCLCTPPFCSSQSLRLKPWLVIFLN